MPPFDNSGHGPLQVPGFGSIPLDYELPPEARFAHGIIEFRHSPRLTMREMAMLRVMQHITEQPQWDQVLLDPDSSQLEQWHREAEVTHGFLISAAAWDWCVAELRDKARVWRETGRLLVFDSSSAVCQANISPSTSATLKDVQKEVARLGREISHESPTLVDPSQFPLVYDRTPVLVDGGRVPLDDLWCSNGQISTELPPHPLDRTRRPLRAHRDSDRPRVTSRTPGYGGPESCWSNRFQWLPCEVEFTPTPNTDTEVRITSYVNNLHPHDNRALYTHLEHLISCSIPSWNEILFYGKTRGRHPPRILTYGCHIENYMESVKVRKRLFPLLQWSGSYSKEEQQELSALAREYITGPEPPVWKQARARPELPANLLEMLTPENWECPRDVCRAMCIKQGRRAWYEHPEPGVSFSYEQWKEGRFTGRAVFPQAKGKFPDPLHHEYVPVSLQEKFRQDGLQVVVQIERIDLTPDNPMYAGEAHYHTEGLRNEHIVATTMYVVEAENVTQARVAFQHEDKVHAGELQCEVPEALATILDVDDWEIFVEKPPKALHAFGSVPAIEGRLLSWPNTLQSKQEPFTLLDPSQPGHLTVIKLRLVDPHYRICSTRNVAPQQHDWWAAAALCASGLDARLPPELVRLVMEETDWWPMSTADAQRLREDFGGDQKLAREAAEDCVGHHVVVFLPYDANDSTDATGVHESP